MRSETTPIAPSGGNGPEPVECSRCGHTAPPEGLGRCEQCKSWLPKNRAAWKHGLRAYEATGLLPDDLKAYLDRFEAELVRGHFGGEDNVPPLQRGLLGLLRDSEAKRLLLLDFALRTGVDTKRGRQALRDHTGVTDSWLRIAKSIGLRRRPDVVDVARELSGLRT